MPSFPPQGDPAPRSSLRPLVGLALTGYGLLVIADVLAHDDARAGGFLLALGLLLLIPGIPPLQLRKAKTIAAVGACLVIAVLAYNLAADSSLGAPEWGLLLYGAALVAASPFLTRDLGRFPVASIVGWSFPAVLAPLCVFALNAVLSTDSSGAAASPLIRWTMVFPTAGALRLIGTPVEVDGSTLMLTTPRGGLSLGVGLVCAGLYPMVLFAGLVGLHAWRHHEPARKVAAYLGIGLLGLWIVNLVRLVSLAKVGQLWGPDMLQRAHENLGWVFFTLYMIAFWAFIFRGREPTRPTASTVHSA